jgi:sterol 14-demethylase
VIALTGEQSRKVFFNDNSLDMSEGYRILMGAAPSLNDIDISTDFETKRQEKIKRLLTLFRKDRVAASSYKFPLSFCVVLYFRSSSHPPLRFEHKNAWLEKGGEDEPFQ